MKKILSLICVAAFATTITAQDSLPTEKAREIARLLNGYAGELAKPPFRFEPDLQNAQGIAKDNRGMIFIPQKGLKASEVAKAGAEVVPVGMLWSRNVAPTRKGFPADPDQLREVTVSERGKKTAVFAFFVGIGTQEGGRQELLVYGAGQEPLLRSRVLSMPARQDAPVEMAVYGDDTGAMLLLSLLGKYQAEVDIALVEESAPEPKSSKP
jgi:hypothetical protein